MVRVSQSIDIEIPIERVYNQWTQFETFPRFMGGVADVRQIDETHLHWVAEVGGRTKEWDAEITQQHPDDRIAWRSVSGALNSGEVSFSPLGTSGTRVTLQLEAEPDGVVEQVGAAAGLLERRVKGDLERFRDFIERRKHETGAWRGEVGSTSSR